MEELTLEGRLYALYLQGEKQSCAERGGAESYPYDFVKYWFDGIGKATDKTRREETVFVFTTWGSEDDPRRDLKDYIISSDSPRRCPEKPNLIPERVPDLVDVIVAEGIIRQAGEQRVRQIPCVYFGQLPRAWLAREGFVTDEKLR